MITVSEENCTGCGVCESVCPVGIFTVVNGKARVGSKQDCIKCRNCETSCPMNCIGVEE